MNKNLIRIVSLLPGVVNYNKRGYKMGCYGINGEGKGLNSYFSFVFFCVGGFPHLGGERGMGG